MRAFLLAAAVLALTISGCSSTDDAATTSGAPTTGTTTAPPMNHTVVTHQVQLKGNAFVNATLTIHSGDTVHWTHADDTTTAHSVTADDGTFDSSPNCLGAGGIGIPLSQACMAAGDSFEQTFTKVGTVKYHCRVHSGMVGTITVEAMMM